MFTRTDTSRTTGIWLVCVLSLTALLLVVGCSTKDNPTGPDPNPNPGSSLTCQITSLAPTSGPAPLQVSFGGAASGGTPPYSFTWRFGDGTQSASQAANHVFQSAGSYSVWLVVADAAGNRDSAQRTITVSTANQLTCAMSANKTNGSAPLAVNFIGTAGGGTPPYSYSWTFGDGATSSQKNPSHTYTTAGSYSAELTVTDASSATVSKTLTIVVSSPGSPLSCSATASPSSGRAPLAVSFQASATGGQGPYTFAWTFGDGSSSSAQNPSHTYSSAGTYTARLLIKDAAGVQCTKSIGIQAVDQAAGPVLSGPANSTGSITLSWTFSWPPLAATGEGFSIEQSTTGANSGFSEIAQVVRGNPHQLTINRSPGTYYFRVRAYVNQGPARGWTAYSNVIQVKVSMPTSRTRFVNNTSYPIISLIIDGVQYFVASPQGILPGNYVEVDLSPGGHSYSMANGFWDGSSRFEMYTLSGTVNQRSGQTEVIQFDDPTIRQILTQFNNSGYWEGTFWQNLQPHVAGFRFYSNGTWRLYVDGSETQTGTYTLVSRSPGSFSLEFSVGGYTGTLYETFGKFVMRNGPSNWPLIEYFYSGQ